MSDALVLGMAAEVRQIAEEAQAAAGRVDRLLRELEEARADLELLARKQATALQRLQGYLVRGEAPPIQDSAEAAAERMLRALQ
jgi:hypothetical protein